MYNISRINVPSVGETDSNLFVLLDSQSYKYAKSIVVPHAISNMKVVAI